MKDNLINFIKRKGYRITPLVKILLDIFYKSDVHLSVSDLISELKKESISPNKTTLYRQLNKLTQMDILQENIFPDTVKRYCVQYKHHHHHHFICDKCGSIKGIAINNCKNITKKLTNQLKNEGYMPKQHIIDFIGICNNCLTT